MDEKLKSENMQKRAVFYVEAYVIILRAIWVGRCRERRYADHIFIEIYFRMHHFVVKFSKFSSPQAARGIDPPNQNPADVPGLPTCLLLAPTVSAPLLTAIISLSMLLLAPFVSTTARTHSDETPCSRALHAIA